MIIIYPLNENVTEEMMKEICGQFGVVKDVQFQWKLIENKETKSIQSEQIYVAFIQFNAKKEALKAQSNLNGKIIENNSVIVRFATNDDFIETVHSNRNDRDHQ